MRNMYYAFDDKTTLKVFALRRKPTFLNRGSLDFLLNANTLNALMRTLSMLGRNPRHSPPLSQWQNFLSEPSWTQLDCPPYSLILLTSPSTRALPVCSSSVTVASKWASPGEVTKETRCRAWRRFVLRPKYNLESKFKHNIYMGQDSLSLIRNWKD